MGVGKEAPLVVLNPFALHKSFIHSLRSMISSKDLHPLDDINYATLGVI